MKPRKNDFCSILNLRRTGGMRYEVYRFRQAVQDKSETLDQFHTRLRILSHTCEFTDLEFELEEQIIIGGLSSKIRKQALRNPKFKLADMLIEGRRDEQSKFQARDIESEEVKIAETNQVSKPYRVNTEKKHTAKCRNCGGAYPHTGPCPARGKQCYKCSKLNHFASVCQGKRNSTKFTQASKTNTRSEDKKTVQTLTHDNSIELYFFHGGCVQYGRN